jgi:hypothetical protein
MSEWSPSTHTAEQGSGLLVVLSLPAGLKLSLEMLRPASGCALWLSTWLTLFLQGKPRYELNEDATFFYVVFGDFDVSKPALGLVDGVSVIEAGSGGFHKGPPDGVGVKASSLVQLAIDCLRPDL